VRYRVVLLPAARKNLTALDRLPVARRIEAAIRSLGNEPRPRGSIKLAGSLAWRIRVCDYRVIYNIDDVVRILSVTKVGHRRDVYEDE
jgi:mRNA interferase RelE/StbE